MTKIYLIEFVRTDLRPRLLSKITKTPQSFYLSPITILHSAMHHKTLHHNHFSPFQNEKMGNGFLPVRPEGRLQAPSLLARPLHSGRSRALDRSHNRGSRKRNHLLLRLIPRSGHHLLQRERGYRPKTKVRASLPVRLCSLCPPLRRHRTRDE